ncbi:MAG: hydroxymethylglutaryl-CoA lyase [Saprospiraceae bacterium]|nr:hydroxymethylglutaryl-CoA lyase [Saprospiraceae bacterium]
MKIIETPRDGMQGIKEFIPTELKIEYINSLLKVGFDTVEVGSFVSAEAIPQLSDTAEVLKKLNISEIKSKLMVLAANIKGAKIASSFENINYILYPFSASESFLKRNINSDFNKSKKIIDEFQNICLKQNKELIVYIAMSFGNPYGDKWHPEIICEWVDYLSKLEIGIIPLSDITGESNPEKISNVYSLLNKEFPDIEFGFHLHTDKKSWKEKVDAAYKNGCRRFDTVIGGMGGCPMTGYELLANLNTFDLLDYCSENKIETKLDKSKLEEARRIASKIIK